MEFQAMVSVWRRILINTRARTTVVPYYWGESPLAVNSGSLVLLPSPVGSTFHPKHTNTAFKHSHPWNRQCLKTILALKKPKFTWAGNVIQEFPFNRVCSTTVQPRTINTTHLLGYGNGLSIKNVSVLWLHPTQGQNKQPTTRRYREWCLNWSREK